MAYLYNLDRSPSSSPRSPRPTVMEIRPAVPTTLASSSSSSSTARQLFPPDAHQFGKLCALCRKEPHPNEPRINGITSPCHHIFCHECMLQWILLLKKTVCPLSHCACKLAKVILTKHCPKSRAELVGLMKSFEGKRKGAIERYDHLVYYEGKDILDEIKRLMKFNCCNFNFNNMNGVLVRNEMIWARQKLHMKQMHKESEYCKLCFFNLPDVFPSEFELYCDATALSRHLNKPDLVSGHTVFHPLCTLCDKPERFFDNGALIEHCLENHYTCLVCNTAKRFYLDVEALNEHVGGVHYPCNLCPSEEGKVGFLTLNLLKEHLRIEHGEQWPKHEKDQDDELKQEKVNWNKKPNPESESSFLVDLSEPVPVESVPEKVCEPVIKNPEPDFPQLTPKSHPQTPLPPTPPKGKWSKKKRTPRKSLKVANLSDLVFPPAPFGAILPALPVSSTGPSYSKIVQQNTVVASDSTVLPVESSDLVAQESKKTESNESSEVFEDAEESWPNGLEFVDSNNNNEDQESTATVSEPISTPRKRRNTYADIAASPPPVPRNVDEEEQAEEVIGVLSYEQIEALVDPGFSGSPESYFGSPEPTSSIVGPSTTTPTGAMTFSQVEAQASPSRRIRSVSSIQLQPTHFPDRPIALDSIVFPRLGRRPSELVDGNNNNVLNYAMLGIRTNHHAHGQHINRRGRS